MSRFSGAASCRTSSGYPRADEVKRTSRKGSVIIEHMLNGPLRQERDRQAVKAAFDATLTRGQAFFLAMLDGKPTAVPCDDIDTAAHLWDVVC